MAPFHVIFPGNKRVDVKFKDFLVKTDQSKKNEGDETAPEPFALFLASLASCAGIYAKSFCDTRELNTEGMNLELTPFFKKGQKHMDKIEITLHVNQKFPEKYIKPIIKAMSACAVKNQLNPEIGSDIWVAYLEE